MESWDRPTLDATEWSNLFDGLAETEKVVAEYGLTQVVHPHVNTLIETADEFERFLDNSSATRSASTPVISSSVMPIRVAIAEQHGDRVGLVHVKDVDKDDRGAIPGRRVRLDGRNSARSVPVGGFRRCAHRCYGSNARSSPVTPDGTYWNKM